MTTLVYSDGELAFDSLVSENGGKVGFITKGIRTKTHLVAFCGELSYLPLVLDWAAGGFKAAARPEIPEGAEMEAVIVTRSTGQLWIMDRRLKRIKLENAQYCAGSGAQYAWGALAMGANPYRAVEVASEFDSSTGGPITCLEK